MAELSELDPEGGLFAALSESGRAARFGDSLVVAAERLPELRAALSAARAAEHARGAAAARALPTSGSAVPDAIVGGGKASGPHSIIRDDDKILGVVLDGKLAYDRSADVRTRHLLEGVRPENTAAEDSDPEIVEDDRKDKDEDADEEDDDR